MKQVTIGIPVFNGAATIEEAITCLLEGSYKDIQIVVSDNCSTDNTVSIVKTIAARDERVKLFQQTDNIGPLANFRFVAQKATSPFFAWRAHDDLSDPFYIEKLLNALSENPRASLCAPHTTTSKIKGERHRPFTPKLTGSATAEWHHFSQAEAGWFYGLYRTPVAKKAVVFTADFYPHVWGWDYVVILIALMNGGVIGCNEAHFVHRIMNASTGAYAFSKRQLRQIAVDFYRTALAAEQLNPLYWGQRQVLKAKIWHLILRRVVRLGRLI
nr:glycosyltransferase family 2 protein [uncultured Cohaesibacter sp.]